LVYGLASPQVTYISFGSIASILPCPLSCPLSPTPDTIWRRTFNPKSASACGRFVELASQVPNGLPVRQFDVFRMTRASRQKRAADVRVCEGFRMPAADERCHGLGRPASETLQGRKPRNFDRAEFRPALCRLRVKSRKPQSGHKISASLRTAEVGAPAMTGAIIPGPTLTWRAARSLRRLCRWPKRH
jgi:hypothetical protein